MINLSGQLSIRTVSGRNGDFNVGRLVTSIGEFVVKDADLDQYDEGKYDGDFAISQISPTYYSTNGRLVVEIRAALGGMTLSGIDLLNADEASKSATQEVDPADEAKPVKTAKPEKDTAPLGIDTPKVEKPKASKGNKTASPKNEDNSLSDEALFGILWPMGDVVKLDSTVDRLLFRQQCARLGDLGYDFNFESQDWHKAACNL